LEAYGSSLAGLLLEELLGLVDTLGEHVIVPHVEVDLEDGQIDEHTSDLGGEVGTADALNEGENAGTNVLLVAGVLSDNSSNNRHSLGEVGLLNGSGLNLGHLGLSSRHGLGNGHLLLHRVGLGHRHLLLAHVLVLGAGSLVAVVIALLVSTLVLTTLVTTLMSGVLGVLLVLLTGSLSLSLSLVHFLEVALVDKETEEVHNFIRVLEVLDAAGVLSLVALEVLLILLHLVVHITVLLDFIVVDIKRVVVNLVS